MNVIIEHATHHLNFTEHKLSDRMFTWHVPPGKTYFDKSKLWKEARTIVRNNLPGAPRCAYILKMAKKDLNPSEAKHARADDTLKQVHGVLAVVASRSPLAVLDNAYMRLYLKALDPKHKPPHHLAINRMIEVATDLAMQELVRMMEDSAKDVDKAFMCISQDFVTDPNFRKSFGVIMADFVAEKYVMEDGRELFMSRETAEFNSGLLLTVRYLILGCCCISRCSPF